MTKRGSQGPEIIATVGGAVDETSVCLAVYGTELDPSEITRRLGVQPSSAHRRGDRKTPESQPHRTGAWLLELRAEAPTGPEQLIRRLLMKVPADHDVWSDLRSRFDVQFCIAVHFTGWNKGFDLSSEVVADLARLGASIGLDIYGYGDEDA